MAETHVLSALIAKRSELAGKIEFVQTELRQLIIDLDHLDATIRLFDPDIDLVAVKPKPLPARNTAFRGEVARIVLSTLRKAEKPLPLYEITMHVMVARSLNAADKPLLKVLAKRVGSCLRNNREKGLVRSVIWPNRSVLWDALGFGQLLFVKFGFVHVLGLSDQHVCGHVANVRAHVGVAGEEHEVVVKIFVDGDVEGLCVSLVWLSSSLVGHATTANRRPN